jgi:hypothetical protein
VKVAPPPTVPSIRKTEALLLAILKAKLVLPIALFRSRTPPFAVTVPVPVSAR